MPPSYVQINMLTLANYTLIEAQCKIKKNNLGSLIQLQALTFAFLSFCVIPILLLLSN